MYNPHKKVCMTSLLAMMCRLFVNYGRLYFTRVAPCYQYNIGISQHFLLRDMYWLSRYAFDVPILYKPTGSQTVRKVSQQRLTYNPGSAKAQIAKFTVTLYFSPKVYT